MLDSGRILKGLTCGHAMCCRCYGLLQYEQPIYWDNSTKAWVEQEPGTLIPYFAFAVESHNYIKCAKCKRAMNVNEVKTLFLE